MHNFIYSLNRLPIANRDVDHKIVYEHSISTSFMVFDGDSFEYNDDSFHICIDGIIYNDGELLNAYAAPNMSSLLIHLYIKYGYAFIKELNGNFRGLILDKKNGKAFIFTDKISSKPIYYYINDKFIIVAGSFKLLSEKLRQSNINIHLDEISSKLLLSIGYLLENRTLAEEIKKLPAGHTISFEPEEIEVICYHRFSSDVKVSDSKAQIMAELDERFRNAVTLEYEKDKQFNRRHITTLSGGLDSRTVVVTANHLGYDSTNITLADSGYLDDRIAKKISKHLRSEFIFHSLDPGNYLAAIEENVNTNGGTVIYSGSAHLRYVLKRINLAEFGVLHTGLLGDGILGSFLSKPYTLSPSIENCFGGIDLLGLQSFVETIMKEYETEEIFKLYQRGFNAVNNGFLATNDLIPIASPFLEDNFLTYSLTIPEKYKYQERIYRKWIIEKYPIINRYAWERTGLIPSFPPWIRYVTKGIKYSFALIQGNSRLNTSMNPEDYYLKSKPLLKKQIDSYAKLHMELLEQKPKLLNIIQRDYFSKSFRNQATVITLLSAIKLFRLI